jgi:rare lipoprotein A (peptidoglycan hydrolase)
MTAKRKKTGVLLAMATPLCAGAFAMHASAGTGGVRAQLGARRGSARHSRSTRAHTKLSKTAVASWYGPGLFGNRTACGQILSPHVIGVAHRTLACGTLVRLTYRERDLVAPVIDRGPYAHGVTWDLTQRAAHLLGFSGTGKVRALVLGHASPTANAGARGASVSAGSTGGSAAD